MRIAHTHLFVLKIDRNKKQSHTIIKEILQHKQTFVLKQKKQEGDTMFNEDNSANNWNDYWQWQDDDYLNDFMLSQEREELEREAEEERRMQEEQDRLAQEVERERELERQERYWETQMYLPEQQHESFMNETHNNFMQQHEDFQQQTQFFNDFMDNPFGW